ncbi:exodeoxyribonuclease V, Alpha domain protein, partial [Chlamydia psittaci 06-1683]
STTLRFITV